MTSPVDGIEHEGALLALIVPDGYSRPGGCFFTPRYLSHQLASIRIRGQGDPGPEFYWHSTDVLARYVSRPDVQIRSGFSSVTPWSWCHWATGLAAFEWYGESLGNQHTANVSAVRLQSPTASSVVAALCSKRPGQARAFDELEVEIAASDNIVKTA